MIYPKLSDGTIDWCVMCKHEGRDLYDWCCECEYSENSDDPPTKYEPKPMTNADRIRSMSDEELANFLALQQINIVTAIYKAFDEPVPDAMTGAREEWIDWLKKEEHDEIY